MRLATAVGMLISIFACEKPHRQCGPRLTHMTHLTQLLYVGSKVYFELFYVGGHNVITGLKRTIVIIKIVYPHK